MQGGIEGHDYPGGNAGEAGSEEGKEDDVAAGGSGASEDSGNHKGVSDEHKFAPYLSDNYDSFFDEESRILQIILYKDCEEDLVILDDLLWDHEGMEVIIDLNGYTLFAKGVHPAAITVFGSLTIQDSVGGGRIDGSGKKNIRGIKVGRHGSLRIEDGVTICNFNVRGNGGGILAEKGARVTLSGATITGNTASGNGGGLFSYAAESLEFQGPQNIISRNHAENGGGIAFSVMQAERDEDAPVFSYTLDNVSVFANKADENGGGIYFDGISDVCLEGSLAVSGNMAGKNGGGLYFRSQSSLARVRDGARIGGNTAKKGNGGGIHMTGLYSGLLMEGGIIGAVDAEAYDPGASEEDISGSYVDDAEAAELAAGRGNLAAAGSGGGVCLYWRNTLDVENGSIEGNQAAEQDDDVFLDTGNYSIYAGEGENDTGSLAGVLTAEGSDYTVNVWYRKEAEIPADAELMVEKLDEDRDEYADFLSMKEEEVAAQSDGEKKISSAAFFDLKILSDGEEILPAAPVEVWISYDGMMADGDTEELEVTDLSDEEGQGQVDFELREVQKGGGVLETTSLETVSLESLSASRAEADWGDEFADEADSDDEFDNASDSDVELVDASDSDVEFADEIHSDEETIEKAEQSGDSSEEAVLSEELTDEASLFEDSSEEAALFADSSDEASLFEEETDETVFSDDSSEEAALLEETEELAEDAGMEGAVPEADASEDIATEEAASEDTATEDVGTDESADQEISDNEKSAGRTSGQAQAVVFSTERLSICGIFGTMLEKNVLASDGREYKIRVDFGPEAKIPQGAQLDVTELMGEAYDDYLDRTAAAMEATGFSYARIFDISILDRDGEHVNPAARANVSVKLLDAGDNGDDFSVIHFSGEEEEPEFISAETDVNTFSFSTESFSAYAIVQGPESIPIGWMHVTTMERLTELSSKGMIMSTQAGFFLTEKEGTANDGTKGILKIKPAKTTPPDNAAYYYFEAATGEASDGEEENSSSEGTAGEGGNSEDVENAEDNAIEGYYIYCYGEDGSKQYLTNDGGESILFSESDKTAFELILEKDGRWRIHNGDRYLNMWQDANGTIIAAWNVAGDKNNYFYLWENLEVSEDPYGMDGQSFGLMNWNYSAAGRAMMARSSNENSLDAIPLTVMSKSESDRIYVPNGSDITEWTFTWLEQDIYHVTAVVDGMTQYLRIDSSGPSLSDTADENCRIQMLPGTGTHLGEVSLKNGSNMIYYSGHLDTGFKVNGASGNEWLKLTEVSELTQDYFLTYSAKKVSVSDPEVTNGSRIIVYTRVWNESLKKYLYYAVDQDGSLKPCYESGDDIQWVGSILNSMLWNFVEYYWEGTDEPNNYYELYNQYSQKYIAPQVTNGQILSDNIIGINLNGRKHGQYYSTVLAWDEENYAYVGLKADVGNGTIVACPKSEADDFYFAIVRDIPVDAELHTVPTIDNRQHGISMRMANFAKREDMSTFIGSDNGYKHGNTEPNLLSTALGEDGYPVTKAEKSLKEWFDGVEEVNGLFIESTYNATGYYEYDSVQNFAHLDQEKHEFVVYKEIGTTDSYSGKFATHGQFFPFNDLKDGVFSIQKNLTDALGNSLPDTDPRKYEQLYHIQDPANPDYYMGMELSASFTQTPDGLDAWGHDIIYEFTGDDDFWLYVDGELVIDLGGIHDALAGKVNFRTGEVEVNKVHTTLKDLFYNNYIGRGMTEEEAQQRIDEIFERKVVESGEGAEDEVRYIFKDYTNHTMRIFYTERGASASNLHMRFNLSAMKEGTVQLTKRLSDVDASEGVLAEIPYQVIYRTEDGAEHYLTNAVPHDRDRTDNYVYHLGTTNPVKYQTEIEIDGITYNDVFFLEPEETAEISFPEEIRDYRIVECGVNTDVYDAVFANGKKLTGSGNDAGSHRDFAIENDTMANRAKVDYVNAVSPEALRNLQITKNLFREDGETRLSHDEDNSVFSFRLYMATEYEDDLDGSPANMHTYHVKTKDGYYCGWDTEAQKFTVIGSGITDYSALTEQEKEAASFTTSMNGSISRIPIDYVVELRNVLAGTRFKLVERPSELPDGYSFQKYLYYDGDGEEAESFDDAAAGVSKVIKVGADPLVVVCNLKGWGLRVNKVWTDADYMSERDDTYFAVYTHVGSEDSDELALVEGTVRRLKKDEKTLYWYFLPLPVNVPFGWYEIYEVALQGEPVVGTDGSVSGYSGIRPVKDGGKITLGGKLKGENEASSLSYTVGYERGELGTNTNVRVDTVTNDRLGILLKKTDWSGRPLEGAVFTLQEGDNVIGSFTSDKEGLVTKAYLGIGKDYTLKETGAPQGYGGLDQDLTLRLDASGKLLVNGSDTAPENADYSITQETGGMMATIIVWNRATNFQVKKIDAVTKEALPGVSFALHKQVTVDGVTSFTLNPMAGYDALLSDAQGIIPKIDNTLPAGTYQLREKATVAGYRLMSEYIVFNISSTGGIALVNPPEGVELVRAEDGGRASYLLNISNAPFKQISFRKTDMATDSDVNLSGAVFALYRVVNKKREEKPMLSGLVSGSDGLLSDGKKTVFELDYGIYELIETAAPEGYNLKGTTVTVNINEKGVSYSLDSGLSYSDYGVSFNNNVYTVSITNARGYRMPSTGGPGSIPFYTIGLMLALLGGAYLSMRKEEDL